MIYVLIMVYSMVYISIMIYFMGNSMVTSLWKQMILFYFISRQYPST